MNANEMQTETEQTETEIYKWEGLFGPGPYRFLGVTREVFQSVPGAPLQPGTSCDRCGQGIFNACRFVSADGRSFKVGADCAKASTDKRVVSAVVRVQSKATKARKQDRVACAVEAFQASRARFEALPHPNAQLASKGATLADYVEWMFKRAGLTGKTKVARLIETTLG